MISVIAVIITLLIAFSLLKQNKEKQRYEEMRNYYESKLYDINTQLTSTPERWKDANHLILSTNNRDMIKNNDTTDNNISEISFYLKSHGITHEDLKVDKKSIFVLTPFLESKRPIYDAIMNVCNKVGLKSSRGDEEYINGDILPHILKKILKARIVIANIDGRNPNVFYELGIAHALDKPTILISKSINDAPFDLKSKSIIIYQDLPDLEQKLNVALTKYILAEDDK